MGKLILEVQTSIDGYMGAKDGSLDFLVWNWAADWPWDKKLQDYHTKVITSSDGILLSANMAEGEFYKHWKKIAAKTGEQQAFASHLMNTTKYIFSTRDKSEIKIPGGWKSSEWRGAELKKEVLNLKKEHKQLIAFGGSKFVNALISAKLVDEFHLLVNPTALGKGLPVFPTKNSRNKLQLKKATGYSCGVTLLQYVSA